MFCAAYNGLDCAEQRCLVHSLRESAKLREELPWQSVRAFIQPLIDLFRDAIQWGKDREELGPAKLGKTQQRYVKFRPSVRKSFWLDDFPGFRPTDKQRVKA